MVERSLLPDMEVYGQPQTIVPAPWLSGVGCSADDPVLRGRADGDRPRIPGWDHRHSLDQPRQIRLRLVGAVAVAGTHRPHLGYRIRRLFDSAADTAHSR